MMWMILQADKPEDWVIATGVSTSVRSFVELAFKEVGIEIEFKGSGINEKAFVVSSNNKKYFLQPGKEVLSIDPNYFRPTEVDYLIGDPTKAKTQLGWEPVFDLKALIKEMVESDLLQVQKNYLNEGGYS